MIPLQHVPLYSANSYPSRYWTAQRNTTEWSLFMTELVNSGNAISKLLLSTLPSALPKAHIGSCLLPSMCDTIVFREQILISYFLYRAVWFVWIVLRYTGTPPKLPKRNSTSKHHWCRSVMYPQHKRKHIRHRRLHHRNWNKCRQFRMVSPHLSNSELAKTRFRLLIRGVCTVPSYIGLMSFIRLNKQIEWLLGK